MTIKKVNGFMASCLASEKAKGNEVLKDINTEKYNGVDVKKVDKDRKSLIGYLTKYITKNDIEFTHLPWHCSRDVSRMFTTINFNEQEKDIYANQLPRKKEFYSFHKGNEFKAWGFKFKPNPEIFEELDIANEVVYKNQ
jgi:hypothetical protein